MYRASLQEANFVKIWYLSKICFKTEGTVWKNQQNKKAVQNTQPFISPDSIYPFRGVNFSTLLSCGFTFLRNE